MQAQRKIQLLTVTLGILSFATPSFAQKKSRKPAAEAPKPAAAVPAAAAEPTAKDKNDPVAFNAKDVWNVDIFDRDDNKVLVIQDRKYNKAGRLELGFDLGALSASPYYKTLSYGGRATYHLSEYWGVELYGTKYKSSFSAEGNQLNDFFIEKNFPVAKEFRRPDFFTSASVVWSPIYGKFAFFRSNIIHFDFYGQLGVSQFRTIGIKTIKDQTPTASEKTTAQNHLGSLVAVGARVFLNKHFIWRFDIRNNIYNVDYAATEDNGKRSSVTHSALHFSTGVSYLFNIGGF